MSSQRDLQKWFLAHIADNGEPYRLDKNQAKIVLDQHENCLVVARAGSGKTRTIVAKIVYLLAHNHIAPEKLIVFAFNRKARIEINERLTKITFDGKTLFNKTPSIATTFHAFAYKILGGKKVLSSKLISEEADYSILKNIICDLKKLPRKSILEPKLIEGAKQFINRAEQKFFDNFSILEEKIQNVDDKQLLNRLQFLYLVLLKYKQALRRLRLINFNEMMSAAATEIISQQRNFSYSYIFVDEYQDFSKLFLNLIQSIRMKSPNSMLLAVGDDWQAINRFAGSDVEYFQNFKHYFPKDSATLFIPTNYRSGKKIVNNANYFMSKSLKDYHGCKSGNKLSAKIYYKNMLFERYSDVINNIVANNPGKSIKLLSRNNEVSFTKFGLANLVQKIQPLFPSCEISESTIHRSKGLEADVVILVEIDASKFPSLDKSNNLFTVFGDSKKIIFQDEARLFYVALTRAKEKLYILSKTPKPTKENRKFNFFSYLNEEWLEEF